MSETVLNEHGLDVSPEATMRRREFWQRVGIAAPAVLVLTGAAQRAYAQQAGSPPVTTAPPETTQPPSLTTTEPPSLTTTEPPNLTTTEPPSLTTTPPPGGNQCPLSQGYWRTHPEAWPVATLTLGSLVYTKGVCLTIMGTAVTGDASLILARQLIAAKLNVAAGASAPLLVTAAIGTADSLLGDVLIPQGVAPASSLGQAMVGVASSLEAWNAGGCGAQ